jgi:hypothetical protein
MYDYTHKEMGETDSNITLSGPTPLPSRQGHIEADQQTHHSTTSLYYRIEGRHQRSERGSDRFIRVALVEMSNNYWI